MHGGDRSPAGMNDGDIQYDDGESDQSLEKAMAVADEKMILKACANALRK